MDRQTQTNTIFGSWFDDTSYKHQLQEQFNNAQPFEHVIIPSFLQHDVAEQIMREFPSPSSSSTLHDWKHYNNPLEQKYALNQLIGLPRIQSVFNELMSTSVLATLREITMINNLETDPHFHGAGLHAYPGDRGKLDIHLDYSLHPISGKERRCNLIIYLNEDWKDEYGGNLQLYNEDRTHCTDMIAPSFNTAVLFRTSDLSYHGLPKPMNAPSSMFRKSLAIYYVSEPRVKATQRAKAQFFPDRQMLQDLPTDIQERLLPLYDIRPYRLIQPSDLWDDWKRDGIKYGWW